VIQHQGEHRDLPSSQRLKGQSRMVDPTKSGPADDDHGQLHLLHEVQNIVRRRERDIETPDTFDQRDRMACAESAESREDGAQPNRLALQAGRGQWRNRGAETVWADHRQLLMAGCRNLQPERIAAQGARRGHTGFDRLHDADVDASVGQMTRQRRRDNGFPHSGVRTGDECSAVHRQDPMATGI